MKPTRESMESHFAELNDAALLRAAGERGVLTPEALAILRNELQQRGLSLPEVETNHHAPTPDATTWITVERFRDLSAAIVARGALEAADIPCFLRDENTVRLDWQISNFIGGMRLQVQQQDYDAALTILGQLAPGDADEAESALDAEEHCPACGSPDVHRVERGMGLRAAALWMFALPLPPGSRYWRCDACGRQFDESMLMELPQP